MLIIDTVNKKEKKSSQVTMLGHITDKYLNLNLLLQPTFSPQFIDNTIIVIITIVRQIYASSSACIISFNLCNSHMM